MKGSRAAQRYAKAVLNLALDKGTGAAVDADMRTIRATASENKELQSFLSSPVIPTDKKKAALAQVFSGTSEITTGMFDLLASNKRLDILGDVATKFVIMYDEHNKNNVAVVTTAVAITPDLEQKVLAKVKALTGNDVTVENIIDENILGGFILRVGDTQYDASLAGKLQGLKTEFSNEAFVSKM